MLAMMMTLLLTAPDWVVNLTREKRPNAFWADTVVYPGHGPVTTVGHERRTNPFVGELASP